MFANIVSFTPTDPSKSFFTYKIPKKLSKDLLIGQLVSIPWGKKTTPGLVIEIKKETQVKKPKDIFKILSPIPILLPNYIELLKWMAWYYHASMLDCLKAMLPNLKYHIADSRYQKRKTAERRKQTLILVPTITHIGEILKKINQSKDIVIYHKLLAKKQIWQTWWKVYFGKVSQVIGTRSAIFTQCPNLAKITIIGEEEAGFKDERSPYFDTLTVGQKLAKITAAKLDIQSLSPRVETFFRFRKRIDKPPILPKIRVVSLLEKSAIKKNTAISITLRYLLLEKIGENKSVLLFLNRIRQSGQIYCFDCKFSGYLATSQDICPNCKGTNFRFYSLNLNSVAKEVAKIAPKASIRLVSEKKNQIIQKGKPIITLATSAIFGTALKYSLIGLISADTILNLPDFNSSFRTFSLILKLTQLARKDGEVLIQTYNPQLPAIKYLANFELEKYYQEELILRKKLDLPPYFVMTKLSLRLKNQEKARSEAEKLKSSLEKKSLLVEISNPYPNWQGKPEFNIILKAARREELEDILVHVPATWKVIVDPESLI